MSQRATRDIKLAHASAGRIRLRLGWLHREPAQAAALADSLAELDGMFEVRARAATGSVLCLYAPDLLTTDEIVAHVAETTGATVLTAPVEPEEPPIGGAGHSVARALMWGVRGLDEDLRDATSGRLDLGTLAAAGFLTLGAAEVLVTRKLTMPPWFNLAWWAFRTFTAFEHSESESGQDAAADVVGGQQS